MEKGLQRLGARMKATNKQIGGSHYKDLKYQPLTVAIGNNLGPHEFLVFRYICRHRKKDGVIDIDKAIHTLQMLKEEMYG